MVRRVDRRDRDVGQRSEGRGEDGERGVLRPRPVVADAIEGLLEGRLAPGASVAAGVGGRLVGLTDMRATTKSPTATSATTSAPT